MPFPDVNRFVIRSKDRRQFLLKQIALVTVSNLAINGFLTWFIFGSGLLLKPLASVSIWGWRGFALDIAVTTFLLTLLTLITISKTAHKAIWDKRISPIESRKVTAIILERFPPRLIMIGLKVAIIATIILVPLLIGIMMVSNFETFATQTFVLFKAIYAGILAAVITALVIVDSFIRRDDD